MVLVIPAALQAPQLDADTRQLFEHMAEAGGGPLYELPVDEARLALKATTAQFDLPPADVARVINTAVPARGHQQIPIRIYQPVADADAQSARQSEAVVLLHGGGWALGDLDTHDNMCRYVCAGTGRIVISVDYRRAPEHPFPAGLQDCLTVLRWLPRRLADYAGSSRDMVLMGDSAGANLTAVIAQMARSDLEIDLSRQVLLYPSVDMNDSEQYQSRQLYGGGDYFLGIADIKWLRQMYLPDPGAPLDARISPIHAADFAELADALIITAGFDPLRDEGIAYARRLAEAGNNVELLNFDATIHGFCSFAGALSAGRQALDRVCHWIREPGSSGGV